MSDKNWTPMIVLADDTHARIKYCSFLRVGGGAWVGTVIDRHGTEYDIKQTRENAWEVRLVGDLADTVDDPVTKAPSLELALERALGRKVSS